MKIIKITIVKTKSDKVKARADVYFNWFLLKGFKVLQDPTTLKEYVTPPSYQSSMGWRPLFRTSNKTEWYEIEKAILSEYNRTLMDESLEVPC